MANVLIFVVATIIGCGGLFAIVDGVRNEQRRRASSLQYVRVDAAQEMTNDIQEWLKEQ